MSEAEKANLGPSRPSLLLGGAHLAALWALALVQPLLSVLGKTPEFFVARGNTTGQILLFAFGFTLIPPLVGLGLEALARLIGRNVQWGLHLVLMTLVGACIPLHLLKDQLHWPAGVLIGFSLLLAAAVVFAYSRWRFPRSFMDILSVAPILILIVFIFFSSTSRLIVPRDQPNPVDLTIKNPAPVVMVIVDELPVSSLTTPKGEIDASRFPAFAEIAAHSTWYRNAMASAAYTPLAVPALLTGTKPEHGKLPIAVDYPRSIFTLLGGSYRMNVMESATRICPKDLCPDEVEVPAGKLTDLFSDLWIVSRYQLLPGSLTKNLPDISQTFGDFGDQKETPSTGPTPEPATETPEGTSPEDTDPATTTQVRTGQGAARRIGRIFAGQSSEDELDRVNRFSDSLSAGEERTLNLIHIEKPHYPWRHVPDGQRYSNLASEWSGLLPNDGAWQTWKPVTDIALQRHLLETGYTDTLLGRIIARMKKTGLWDRAMVIVAADHGAAFRPEVQRRTADVLNLGQIAPIPLFIKSPGQEKPDRVLRPVCANEALGLAAERLGIKYPWPKPHCAKKRVEVMNSPTGEAVASMKRVLRQRRDMTGRIADLFGHDDGWKPVYQFGLFSKKLIGQRTGRLPADWRRDRYWVHPEIPNAVKDYDPTAPTLRGLLQRGESSYKIGQNRMLAVSVNGTIQAVGVTFKDGVSEGPGYSILLPPSSLKKGFNRVDIFLVEDAGRRLVPVYDGSKPIPPKTGSGGD